MTVRDPIPAIAASGAEIHRNEVDLIWTDLLEGHYSWSETSHRAGLLLCTANVPNPIVNWGLSTLYHLFRDEADRDLETLTIEYRRWRAHLAQYDRDPETWLRNHFQRAVIHLGQRLGLELAEHFGHGMVRRGLLTEADVRRALDGLGEMP